MYAAKQVHFLLEKNVPHEWLFPRCAAIVHHGGAGTTASALRSGVPSVVTPIAFDQPELAAKVEQAGVGVRLDQLHWLKAADLEKALRFVLDDKALRARAADLGRTLREENGAAAAAARIVQQLEAAAEIPLSMGENEDGRGASECAPCFCLPACIGGPAPGRVSPATPMLRE